MLLALWAVCVRWAFAWHLCLYLIVVVEEMKDPCRPSPCGPYSQCRDYLGYAVCSCVPGYVGAPPACRPECVVSSECALNCACINQKCIDPCPGTCGQNARCQVVNHKATCSCSPGFTGDPFSSCLPEQSKLLGCAWTFYFYLTISAALLCVTKRILWLLI